MKYNKAQNFITYKGLEGRCKLRSSISKLQGSILHENIAPKLRTPKTDEMGRGGSNLENRG